MKPYKGRINNWLKRAAHISSPIDGQDHLNFVIVGQPAGHPDFPNSRLIRTSLVVKYEEIPRHKDEPRKIEIETLNSRYHLIGEGEGL